MKTNLSVKPAKPVVNVAIRIGICAAVLLAGVLGMQTLAAMKKPPAEASSQERALMVEVVTAAAEDVTVTISGYGEVGVLDTVTLSSEVAGKITGTHPRLEVGEIVDKGETLFTIDTADYRAALAEARASVAQMTHGIDLLEKQYAIDRQRLKTMERNRDLARTDFQRIRKLYESGKVVARSTVDNAEQQYNNTADAADRLAQTVALYPLKIKETQSGLAAARARRKLAETRLERCVVTAPFTGRLKTVSVETGQYVNPGQAAVTLADDSLLEIQVPLDSRDARQWLLFSDRRPSAEPSAWFSAVTPVTCRIRWTEDTENHVWQGRLHRVVSFNKQNRTLTVAVRIDAKSALSTDGNGLPLVEGMFCEVAIPGRTLTDVIRLPRWAVSFEQTVYVAENNRLKTVPVKVARIQDEQTLVAGGIEPGDRVITTRLVDPLENALLKITNE